MKFTIKNNSVVRKIRDDRAVLMKIFFYEFTKGVCKNAFSDISAIPSNRPPPDSFRPKRIIEMRKSFTVPDKHRETGKSEIHS